MEQLRPKAKSKTHQEDSGTMRRILAEVLESARLPDAPGDPSGLPWRKVRCLVKLISSVPEHHHTPGCRPTSSLHTLHGTPIW